MIQGQNYMHSATYKLKSELWGWILIIFQSKILSSRRRVLEKIEMESHIARKKIQPTRNFFIKRIWILSSKYLQKSDYVESVPVLCGSRDLISFFFFCVSLPLCCLDWLSLFYWLTKSRLLSPSLPFLSLIMIPWCERRKINFSSA